MKKLSFFIVMLARKALKKKILKERLDNAFDFYEGDISNYNGYTLEK